MRPIESRQPSKSLYYYNRNDCTNNFVFCLDACESIFKVITAGFETLISYMCNRIIYGCY